MTDETIEEKPLLSFRERIRINQENKTAALVRVDEGEEGELIDIDLLERKLIAQITNTEKFNLDTKPRKTLIHLIEQPYDTKFAFRVVKGEGENYINAIRQVLSRTRRRAKAKKITLEQWKLFLDGIDETHAEYTEVTLVRSRTLTGHEISLYDDLVEAMKHTPFKSA